jgi:rhodanese-related sulfurtransferase
MRPWIQRARGLALVGAVAIVVAGWMGGGASALAQGVSIFQGTLLEANQKTGEVSTDELRQILKDGSATVFDARPPMEYATSHIPGALNVAPKPGVPMSLYVSDAAEVGRLVPDKAAPIVLYCNGPFCGKSKRLGEELVEAGYTNVRRYQLGAPTWRALVGVMQVELDGVRYIRDGDRTAVFVDARSAADFQGGSLPGARNIPANEVVAAKDDGRLPIEDHNTRIIVFGVDSEQARAATTEIAKNAFHNVSFFAGTLDDLVAGLGEAPIIAAR